MDPYGGMMGGPPPFAQGMGSAPGVALPPVQPMGMMGGGMGGMGGMMGMVRPEQSAILQLMEAYHQMMVLMGH